MVAVLSLQRSRRLVGVPDAARGLSSDSGAHVTDNRLRLFRMMAQAFLREAQRARFGPARNFALIGAGLCSQVVVAEEKRRAALDQPATVEREVNPPPRAKA